MYKCPINYYKGNMIFTDDGCWGAFQIQGFDYENRSRESKIKILYNIIRFISNIPYEAKILIIPVSQDIKKNYDILRSNLDKNDPLYDAALTHTNMTEEYLTKKIEENGNANDFKTYIITKLTTQDEEDILKKTKDIAEYFLKDPMNALNNVLGLDSRMILKSRIANFKRLCDSFFNEQSKRLTLKYLDDENLQWLFRRVMFRGLNMDVKINKNFKPEVEILNSKTYKPIKSRVESLFEGRINPQKPRYLEIEHDDKSISYQSFLSIACIPDALEFPGSEYIFMLQDYTIPTEVCIHIDRLTDYQSRTVLSNKKKEINSQITNANEAGEEIPEDLLDAKDETTDFEADIRGNKLPICRTSITFCIAADSEEELERRVNFIKGTYEDMEFTVIRSLTDQYKLFMEFIPGAGRYLKDFIMPLPCKMLAGSMLGASKELGDTNGFYIGTTGKIKKDVFLNMARACLENKSAATTFFGNLGYGKSFNANLLTILHVMHGSFGLIFDPKGERDHWTHAFPWLEGYISNIKLSSEDEYRGMLDPFNVYRDNIEAACELANNVITELYKLNPKDDEFIALGESLAKIKNEKQRSMCKLAEMLGEFNEKDDLCKAARNLGRKLNLLQSVGMSKLLFGKGEEKALNLDNRLNILQIENLKLPSPDTPKEDYSQEETLSAVLIMVIGNFAKKFALTQRNVFSIVLFDESWFLKVTSEGRKLYDFLARMGRSLFTGCIFNGHSVLDIPSDAVKNTISYKFCFHTDDTDEAKRMLEYMNMDVTEENINLVIGLENRQCLFQDLDKRVDVLTFDAVFDDLIEAFDTTPKTKDNKQEDQNESN
ncbi:ATP-binding protein [Clostridium akagii]|uniref:ATP-binding protein n=1 Tax=Clostridium akagii TaxID=91623 RepID=UPI00047E8598|nr:ATP-binding protein [Clostridium akagii]